jgi:hypothetical protein
VADALGVADRACVPECTGVVTVVPAAHDHPVVPASKPGLAARLAAAEALPGTSTKPRTGSAAATSPASIEVRLRIRADLQGVPVVRT